MVSAFFGSPKAKEERRELITDVKQIHSKLKELYAGEKENLIMLTCCLC